MKQYTTTAKLWITLQADTQEEAESKAKTLVDEALYAYVRSHDVQVSVAKAKVTWVKEHK